MTTSLNAVLEHRAATAPDVGPVLAAVRAGVRRRRRNRTTAATGASALAVGGLICAAVLLPRQGDATAPSATGAGQPSARSALSSVPASPPSASTEQSILETIAPAPAAVALSLTRVPAGFVYLGQAADEVSAWGPTGTPLAGGFAGKLVVYAAAPASAPATFTTTAADHPAAVKTDGSAVSVVLAVTDDVHVVVQFPAGFQISADEALQVAGSLDVRRAVGGGVG